MRTKLLSDCALNMDKSHYLWLVTYFLKFASQLEVELDQISNVLSANTIAFLTCEGVRSVNILKST